jgi:hypothetical protein
MNQRNRSNQIRSSLPSKRRLFVIIGGLILLVCIGLAFFLLTQPERSVASFCRVVKEEKTTLVGDVNYERRLDSYRRIETVSPDAIRPDITTIRKGYEEIVKSPSSALNTGLGMSGAESRRTTYINSNCKDF